jgi:tetratricopeptide (TPR) repeat protein
MLHGGITRALLTRFRGWDTPSRVAFALAAVLMIGVVVFGRELPADQRQNALIAIAGLFVMMQVIFLYANRGMVSALTRAQRQYLAGDLDGARHTLETALARQPRSDYRLQTLLGNTYRQLGMIEPSHEILTKAVQAAPQHHFPLYGFGRTLMTMGRYADAASAFSAAIAHGAPDVAHLDHAEALYRSGAPAQAIRAALDAAGTPPEAHRTLWAAYLRWRAAEGSAPQAADIAAGIAYWQATAQRFAHTPYGQDLASDLAVLTKETS